MSYFSQFFRKPQNPPASHDKAWNRSAALAWDEKWQALSTPARRAYLHDLKPPSKAIAAPQHGILLNKVPAQVVEELVAAGFAKVEQGVGKKLGKIFAVPATHDFSLRLRALDRYRLLGPTDRTLLTNYVKYVFFNQGETVVAKVLESVEIDEYCRIDEALELYVATSQWPDWTLKSIGTNPAAAVLEVIKKANGPLKIAEIPAMVPGIKAKEAADALTELLNHLAVFEDLKADTLEIMVGLLPIVRERQVMMSKSNQAAPLVVCEKPKEIGPPGGLSINDLRVFLLELAGEAPRLKQDGTLFAKEEQRFLDALPPLPGWIEKLLKMSPERRLYQAFQFARILGFTEAEREDKAIWLRLSGRGKNWLSTSLEEQYGKFYESFRKDGAGVSGLGGYEDLDDLDDLGDLDDEDDFDYDDYYDRPRNYYDHHGDSQFYGISVSIHQFKGNKRQYYTYYTPMAAETRNALRSSVFKAFESLPIGVFHRWDSVVSFLTSGKQNPLTLGGDASKLAIFVNQRQVPRLPESLLQSGRLFLEAFLLQRLLPFDAFRAAIDNEGKLCVARLPRFEGYFGRPYDPGKDETSASTKVIVQPDFSVLVIGLDPAPAVELAPFCDRAGGHAGQGALTFKITRESVVRGSMQGLNAQTILNRLKKYASIEVPANVTNEIKEWAGWVRLVNVKPVMVIRCPDSATVARVVSVLGKKAERLGETMVALHNPNLGAAERQKLQDQGILITKQDITIAPPEPAPTSAAKPADTPKKRSRSPEPAPTSATKPAETPKKRGRPKKVL